MEKAKEIIEYPIATTKAPTESQQRNKTPDDSTEPFILFPQFAKYIFNIVS
jgi:hypothetical protein